MAQQKYKRKIYIIDPGFQYRMIRKSCLVGVAIILMSLFFLAMVHHLYGDVQMMMVTQPNPFISDSTSTTLPPPEPDSLLNLLWPVMAVSVGITLLFLFFYVTIETHRMAGPIFRIRKVLHEMAEGDISGEVHLRKKDEFKHLAKDVDHLKISLRTKIKQMLDIAGKANNYDASYQKNMARITEILSGFKID